MSALEVPKKQGTKRNFGSDGCKKKQSKKKEGTLEQYCGNPDIWIDEIYSKGENIDKILPTSTNNVIITCIAHICE